MADETFDAYYERISTSLGPLMDEREWETTIEPNLEEIRQSVARGGGGPDDEAHWALVRKQFSFDPDRGHMNTGTIGASPLYVRLKTNELRELVERDPWQGLMKVRGHTRAAAGKLAALVNVEPSEIAFTRNVTESMVRVATGLNFRRGDLVVTTNREHGGGLIGWELAHSWRGAKLVYVEMPDVPEDVDGLDDLMVDLFRKTFEQYNTPRYDGKTKLMSISHIFSPLARRLPVKALCALAREFGYYSYIDGAQTIGMVDVDIQDIGCDFYGNSTHKWLLAPKGTGFLYIRKDKLEHLKGLFARNQWNWWKKERKKREIDPSAEWFGAEGTQDHADVCGIGFAIDFLNLIGGIQKVEERGWALACRLRDGIDGLPGLQFITPNQPRRTPSHRRLSGSMTTFLLKDHGNVGEWLKEQDAEFPAWGEWARISTHYYNTPAQVDRIVRMLREIEANEKVDG